MRNYAKKLFYSVLILFLSGPAFSQAPPNDACAKAIAIEPGQKLTNLSNSTATVGPDRETPAVFETTCIQTIENDMWFKFTTAADIEFYEVVISTRFCNTPAGLQALLIRSDVCDEAQYIYRACANKINTDTIFLYLHEPDPGHNYFIYVDGYDGTICEYDLEVRARRNFSPTDYDRLRFDYELDEPVSYELPDLKTDFTNNQTVLEWTAAATEDVAQFMVELLPEFAPETPDASHYARVVGIIKPRNLVGLERTFYEFRDFLTPFREAETYTYRIVRISSQGKRAVSAPFSVKARIIETFFMGTVNELPDRPGFYSVHYINKKKKQSFTVRVRDAEGKELKRTRLEKEPVRDGYVTVDMSPYPPGLYEFEMDNGSDAFRRKFTLPDRPK
ncbi:MAG: hypothetical protein AAGN35_05870 [Bacteroidota bacterium]